ncbi:MAG: hypothetical protein NTX03_02120 [Bacteroidetes bacterium]|nr:hypothetical protein [Bacteroidota bacterium]
METKALKNGKHTPGVGTATAELPKEVTKPQTSTTTVSENGKMENPTNEAPKVELSVEDKIKKVATLAEHIEKRGLLKRHLEKVEGLKFGDYEDKDTLTIAGGNKESYVIKSTSLCQKISALIKEEIGAKIKEVEAEINF